MAPKLRKTPHNFDQSGVIPFRHPKGKLEVLLITSLGGKRWIIPKGIIEPDLSAEESAQEEAFEEAGIKGKIIAKPIGEYQYSKWGGICNVKVYPFRVERILGDYPESHLRKRKWVSVEKAGSLVDIQELVELIRFLPVFLKEEIHND
jgi:8-oxo-dGTP pyrophosphatase MutT (NUDIX family)